MKGKYRKLLDELLRGGKLYDATYQELVKANHAANGPLTDELLNNPDPKVRHLCAHVLGDRKKARAVPALIQALRDKEEFVRQDALWAIEKLCGFEPGGLQDTLLLTNIDPPKKLYSALMKWWTINRRFIVNNSMMW